MQFRMEIFLPEPELRTKLLSFFRATSSFPLDTINVGITCVVDVLFMKVDKGSVLG